MWGFSILNTTWRLRLLDSGGFFDTITSLGTKGTLSLIEWFWQNEFNFEQFAFPRELSARGFERIPLEKQGGDSDPLPGYLYRDYGYLVWDSLENYVRTIIYREFHSDTDIKNDIYIQNWAYEISDVKYGNVPGFPQCIESREHLVQTLTNIIFTATAQHSVVNFGQFEFYSFIPNRPLALTKSMPEDAEHTITWEYVMDALPNESRTRQTMEITSVLSLPPEEVLQMDENTPNLKYIPLSLAHESEPFWRPEFVNDWKNLMMGLNVTEQLMVLRNTRYGYHYEYMYSSRIATSISM